MTKKSNNKNGNGGTNWPVLLLIFCIAVSAPVVGVFTWRASEAMSENDVRVLTGVLIAGLLLVVDTCVLSLFLVAYSRLRRAEEVEESKHELNIMRMAQGQRPETKYNYNIRPGQPIPYQIPLGQTYPQQPMAEAPPKIEYVDSNNVNLGG